MGMRAFCYRRGVKLKAGIVAVIMYIDILPKHEEHQRRSKERGLEDPTVEVASRERSI